MLKIEILTSPTCPYCPMAVTAMEQVAPKFEGKIEWKEVSTATPDGVQRAMMLGVQGVPAIAIDDEVVFVGAPSPDALEKAIKERLK